MNKANKLKAIELFAGIGGFRLGMKAANINTIWANDINELCCQVYQSNFGSSSIVLGDINQINLSEIPEHDILTAGFPCQPFSQAGKKMGIRDKLRGTVFQRIVEIIQAKKPQYFLLENVKRILTMEKGYHFRMILNSLATLDYFIEWRIINTINFGIPQNRDRIFIFGTRMIQSKHKMPDLEKLSIFLTDNDIESLSCHENSDLEKSMKSIINGSSKNYNWGISYKNQMYSQPLPLMFDIKPRKKLKDILQDESEINPQFDFTADTIERIKQSKAINRYCNGVEILYNQGGGARLGYTIFGINGVTSTLTASTSRHYERYQVGNKFRRLTNVEYARLMGFPDNWCRVAKIYDQYILYGNSVVPNCVEWICQRISQENFKFKPKVWEQLTLFS